MFAPVDLFEDEEINSYLDAPCQLSPPARSITPSEIMEEIKKINSHKAPGYDLIVGEILKHLPRRAIVFLTTLYNRILHLSYYPTQWKFAEIIMIAKPGKPPTEAASYRPISLLPILSKIFERLLQSRINSITSINNLIPNHQFGFREKHTTTQQCHRIVNLIRDGLENKNICTAAFLDIQQAFDKVWHQGLLYKLKTNMPSQIYLLLKSYLSDRHFDVKMEKDNRSYQLIRAGVPQGSVLGPFLYLLYTADIPTTNETTIATFADDTAIIALDHDPVVASNKLQTHLDRLQNWLQKWKIKVNHEKSAHITFTNRHVNCPHVTINHQVIPMKTEVKYLGIHLDQKLTWKAHIKAKKQQLQLKTRQMNWLLGRRSQLSIENKLAIYKIILKPIWTYGIELWGCTKPSNTKILQTYQSKTLRIIANAPWYISNQTLHEDLKIPFIKDVIGLHATKHRKRSINHNNELISTLSNRPLPVRRLKRQWPEDLCE